MGRDTETSEAIRDGMLFSADEQFYTDACPRCTGLLVNEWCSDFWNVGEQLTKVLRCVQCGYRIDPVILQNQRRPTVKNVHVGDTRHRCSVSTGMPGEAT